MKTNKISKKIKIIIAEDHKMVRDALKRVFSMHEEYEIIGDVKNGREVIELLKLKSTDVVLMDISMPIMDGIEATRIISKLQNAPKIIALTMHTEKKYIEQIMLAGAKGYVNKDSSTLELFLAIDEVLENGRYISFGMKLLNKIKPHY